MSETVHRVPGQKKFKEIRPVAEAHTSAYNRARMNRREFLQSSAALLLSR